MTNTLLVGIGRHDITPPLGAWLTGYAPARQAESVGDNLNLTAFAFGYNDLRSLLVTADVCLIKAPDGDRVRRAMSAASGIPFEHITLSTTHTHSGPATFRTGGGADMDMEYFDNIFIPAAEKAAAEAVAALRPAEVGVGEIHSDVGINRRQMLQNGTIILGQDPHGTYDPIMTVVSFREPDGKPIGNLIHYGAHNTGSGKNPEITRDWCGVAIDRLEAASGGITAFFNGCEGDCGPRLANGQTVGNYQLALELGGRAAIDAVNAWRSIKEWRSDCDMRVICRTVKLPYKIMPTKEALQAEIDAMGDPDKLIGLAVLQYESLIQRMEMICSGEPIDDNLCLELPVISVGPVAFFPIPFEIFSRITLRIREFSPYPYTLSLSNTNGAYQYFPSMDQICRGGYEVWVFTSLTAHPLADDSEQHLVDRAVEILKELKA
ncbi:MAG: hypothetical protein E7487_05585 [Ruminococcaceae bacterium]|nr:hypothetical protein [Oscillospiraceae bacterium]